MKPMLLILPALFFIASAALCSCGDSPSRPPDSRSGNATFSPVAEPGIKPPEAVSIKPDAGIHDFSQLDHFLSSNDKLFAHSAVLIRQGGEVVYSRGEVHAPIPTASCSKWISAAAIMRLVEKGDLDLDAPIGAVIPGMGKKVSALTLRQLLSHTAGLQAPAAPSPIPDTEESKRDKGQPIWKRLIFRRGTSPTFCYENRGTNLAGTVAVQAAGIPWRELFKREVSATLEMENTHFHAMRPTLAAGASSSAADFSLFLEVFRNGGAGLDGVRFLDAGIVQEMLSPQTTGIPFQCPLRPQGRQQAYGLGMWLQRKDGGIIASHFGSTGFKVFLDLSRHVTAVFAMEFRPGQEDRARRVTRDIYALVEQAVDSSPER